MVIREERADKRKASAALLSVASNSGLLILKLAVGIMIGSVSVISEAIHSGIDLVAAVIAFFAVRNSGKPADSEHPFGHGKVENVSGTIEALLIFLAAGWIILEAVKKFLNPEPLEEAGWGVVVMSISMATNIFVSSMLFKVGKETDSVALQADAWHLRTDVYTSAGVMLSLVAIWIGDLLIPGLNLQWVDPLAAIGVALLICKAAFHLTVESTRDLLDTSLPPDEENQIQKHISAFVPSIRGFHQFRTRKAGSFRFVEFHLKVEPSMSINESHRIADMVTCDIRQQYPGTSVTVHIEPCDCDRSSEESCECFLNGKSRSVNQGSQIKFI